MRSIWKFILAGALAIPAWSSANPPRPGALNYVEGQASIDSQIVDSKSVGSTTLNEAQVLSTENGKAEILLTPGVFLRIDRHSAVRMDSPGLANTALTLEQGRALIEVGDLRKENNLTIREDNATTRLLKKGLYEFNADTAEVRVFDGKAEVLTGDRAVDVGGGRMLALNDPAVKPQKFDKKASEDEFYNWAKLRSSYLAEANAESARVYVAGGPGWYGPGWYWNPWFSSYTWIPGAGVLWSPFGWGYYSPFAIYSAPVVRFGGYYAPRVHAVPNRVIVPRGFSGGRSAGGGFHARHR